MAKLYLNNFSTDEPIEVYASSLEVTNDRLIGDFFGKDRYRYNLTLEWESDKYILYRNPTITQKPFIIMPSPAIGYKYELIKDSCKICAKCGNVCESYIIACNESKYSGKPICVNCLDK